MLVLEIVQAVAVIIVLEVVEELVLAAAEGAAIVNVQAVQLPVHQVVLDAQAAVQDVEDLVEVDVLLVQVVMDVQDAFRVLDVRDVETLVEDVVHLVTVVQMQLV